MATNTYVPIATYTAPSAVSNYTFTSIPSTYTDLICVISTRDTTSAALGSLFAGFNGDTSATNYSYTTLIGNGSAASSSRATNQAVMVLGQHPAALATAGIFGVSIHHIQNYSNTSTYKTVLSRSSSATNSSGETNFYVNLWRSTAAINSFIIGSNTAFAAGSTFSLYGVLSEGGAKATGGVVTSDSTYYYHTFLASGTFTPVSTLSCDVLVVAGGGAGGSNAGGGGGAGGLRGATALSVSTATTVTVGGGGAQNTSASGSSGNNSIFSTITSNGGAGGRGGGFAGNGIAGGSGSGSTGTPSTTFTGGAGNTPSTSPSQGNNGGGSIFASPASGGGGGGGAGGAGATATNNSGGAGGVGSSAYSSWGSATATGQLVSSTYYYAGGGGGSGDPGGGAGGYGGGGTTTGKNTIQAGTAKSGGGGSPSWDNPNPAAPGGSGIVIVRYAKV
jgi:hypothetical protein